MTKRVPKISLLQSLLLQSARCMLLFGLAGSTAAQTTPPAPSAAPVQTISIDASATSTPFPHFWEQMFGSGRAVLSLRESYRNDLRDVKAITDFHYVRFHAIFHDELGVYDEDKNGNPVYNFSYVDQIYDGLLANHVRPFVELSFMPKKLAADPLALHSFWYKQNVSPPRDYAKWDAFIQAFVRHLVDRYGLDEVTQWYFEVWNEPNIDFWRGDPKQATYFEFYDHTARDVKAVSARLRVGGPSTAYAAWVGDMIAHTAAAHVPLDFVSGHIYSDEKVSNVFGPDATEVIPKEDMICRAVGKMHDEIVESAMPAVPLIVSEFNVRSRQLENLDSPYVGPALANTIRQCDGLTSMMSFWTFSDVFEEQGPPKKPFYGGFGLLAEGGIPKPSFIAFQLLHMLGDRRLANPTADILITRRSDGTLALAVWNLTPSGTPRSTKNIQLDLRNFRAGHARIFRVDEQHSDSFEAFRQMGSPQYPTPAQFDELRASAKIGPPEIERVQNRTLRVTLPPNGLALILLR